MRQPYLPPAKPTRGRLWFLHALAGCAIPFIERATGWSTEECMDGIEEWQFSGRRPSASEDLDVLVWRHCHLLSDGLSRLHKRAGEADVAMFTSRKSCTRNPDKLLEVIDYVSDAQLLPEQRPCCGKNGTSPTATFGIADPRRIAESPGAHSCP